MTIEDLAVLLKASGCWRCKIVENFSAGRFGEFELYLPKTCKWQVKAAVMGSVPHYIEVKFKVLDKPLKQKKYTYISECK